MGATQGSPIGNATLGSLCSEKRRRRGMGAGQLVSVFIDAIADFEHAVISVPNKRLLCR